MEGSNFPFLNQSYTDTGFSSLLSRNLNFNPNVFKMARPTRPWNICGPSLFVNKMFRPTIHFYYKKLFLER